MNNQINNQSVEIVTNRKTLLSKIGVTLLLSLMFFALLGLILAMYLPLSSLPEEICAPIGNVLATLGWVSAKIIIVVGVLVILSLPIWVIFDIWKRKD